MMTMREGLVVAALAFVAFACHQAPRSPASPTLAPSASVSSPFDPIADQWTSARVGMGAQLDDRWREFRRLSRRLDRATALTMLKDPRPAVRAWGAQYVLERDLADIGSLRPLLQDDAPVFTQKGCVGDVEPLSLVVSELIAMAGDASEPLDSLDAGIDADDPMLLALKEASVVDASIDPTNRAAMMRGLGPRSAGVVARAAEMLLAEPIYHRPAVREAVRTAMLAHLKKELAGRLGVEEIIAHMPDPTTGPRADRRRAVLEALRSAHVERTTTLVEPLLVDTANPSTPPPSLRESLRVAAVHALSVSGDARAAELLVRLTHDGDYDVRRAAVAGYVASAAADPVRAASLVEASLKNIDPRTNRPDAWAGRDLAADVAAIATPRALDWTERHPQGDGESIFYEMPPHPLPAACEWLRARVHVVPSWVSWTTLPSDSERKRVEGLLHTFGRCATKEDLPLLRERAPWSETFLVIGDVPDLERLMTDSSVMRIQAAERLYWLGAKASVRKIREAAKVPPLEPDLEVIADDLERRPSPSTANP